MKVLDLFSGIGGFSLAAEWMGWETVAFCEREPFCQKVLRKHWPDVPIHDDITTLTVDDTVNACYSALSKQDKEIFTMAAHRKDFDQAVILYDQGMSIQDVADYYEMSRQAMWAILKRRGCVFRPQLKFGEDNHFHRGGAVADDRAQNLLEKAIEKGIVIRKTHCEKCNDTGTFADGRSKIQAHHCDYNKPLEVMWLCQKCHHDWHKDNQAIPRKEVQEEASRLCSIDIVTGGFP